MTRASSPRLHAVLVAAVVAISTGCDESGDAKRTDEGGSRALMVKRVAALDGGAGSGRVTRLVSLPRFGSLGWACRSVEGRPQFLVRFSVPRGGATVVGSARIGTQSVKPFRVDPSEAVVSALSAASKQTWRLLSRHKPAAVSAKIALRFEVPAAGGDCQVATMTIHQGLAG